MTLLFPLYFKKLAVFHRKVLSLKYSYIPFLGLFNFELVYRYKKHIPVVVSCRSITVSRSFKFKLLDFSVKYSPYKPIGIGYRVDISDIHEDYIKHQLSRINTAKYVRRRSGLRKFASVWFDSLLINTALLLLSFSEFSFTGLRVELPKLHYDN